VLFARTRNDGLGHQPLTKRVPRDPGEAAGHQGAEGQPAGRHGTRKKVEGDYAPQIP